MSDFFDDSPNELSEQWLATLRQFNIFQNLEDDHLQFFTRYMETLHLSASQPFFEQYQEIDGIFILDEEAVVSEMDRFTEDTKRNGLFGETECITGQTEATYSATPLKACEALFITREDFLESAKRIPGFIETIQKQIITDYRRKLSALKGEKTTAKEQQRLTKEILENLGVGSISISQSGEIGHNYNNLAEDYLGKKDLAGVPFADIVFRGDRAALRDYYRALQMLFSGNQFDPEVIIGLLPEEVVINERIIKLRYSLVEDRFGNVMSLFVQMEDLTSERNFEEKKKLEKKINDALQANIGGYLSMLDDIKQTMKITGSFYKSTVKTGQQVDNQIVADLLRSLHSAKGICGQFELNALKSTIHKMEDEVLSYNKSAEDVDPEIFEKSLNLFKEEYQYAVSLKNNLGDEIINLLKGINFSQEDFNELLEAFKTNDIKKAERLVIAKTLIPAEKIIDNWKNDIERLAKRTGKQVDVKVNVVNGLNISKIIAHTLNVELGHIYRNCVDHGVELPEEREKLGKPTTGTISINIGIKDDNKLSLQISDDGAGLNEEKIVKIAQNNSNLNQEKIKKLVESKQIWRILFLPGFSSAKVVTDISGRGVGLDAVVDALKSINGRIHLASQRNKGSRFTIITPIK
jgi:two-component system, chemotaxis family, sensor kinase CheA